MESLRFAADEPAIIGGIPHGTFEEIGLQADWYSGDCVFEAPGEPKVTDLEWCEARIQKLDNGDTVAHASVDTPKGRIEKQMRFSGSDRRVDFDITFYWDDWSKGVLRLGHFSLLADAKVFDKDGAAQKWFALDRLRLTTTNGGERETFSLAGKTIDHGALQEYDPQCGAHHHRARKWPWCGARRRSRSPGRRRRRGFAQLSSRRARSRHI